MKECKFCHKEVKRPSHGYCVSCYQYFIMNGYDSLSEKLIAAVSMVFMNAKDGLQVVE